MFTDLTFRQYDPMRPARTGAQDLIWSLRRGAQGLEIAFDSLDKFGPISAFLRRIRPEDHAALSLYFERVMAGMDQGRGLRARLLWPQGGATLVCFERVGPSQGVMMNLPAQMQGARHILELGEIFPAASWRLDVASGDLDIDESWAERLGYRAADLAPFNHDKWASMTHPEDVNEFEDQAIRARLHKGEEVQFVSRNRHRDGSWVSFCSYCRTLAWDAEGKSSIVVGFDLDVTALVGVQAELKEERDRFSLILDVMPVGQVVLDEKLLILYCNTIACEIFDCAYFDALGVRVDALMHLEEGRAELLAALQARVQARLQIVVAGGLGARILQASLVPMGSGQLLLTLTDMTEQVKLQRQLEQSVEHARYIATHDLMTGLPDRYFLMRRLGSVISEAQRQGQQFALLFIDLDNFKMINDTLGHDVGDQLIKSAASRMSRALPETTVFARVGGDEFVALLPLAGGEEAERQARALVQHFARPILHNFRHSYLTVSIGISVFPQDGTSAEGLLRNADLAMYHSKARGRNTISRFNDRLREVLERRAAVCQALQRALDSGGFSLALQPKYRVGDRLDLSGAEVLLRLTDPEMGPISPAEFIPIAEADGMITAIDREVIRQSGALMRLWAARGLRLPVAINLSAATLDAPSAEDLVRFMIEAGLEPKLTTVELTETGLVQLLERRKGTLALLRAAGFTVAIDDFGTGQSSLSYLQSLPIQQLKIDRSFIRGLGGLEHARSAAIVRAILAMAQALELQTVAEGVETPAQRKWLHAAGCFEMQGFLLGRPVEVATFDALYLGGPVLHQRERTA